MKFHVFYSTFTNVFLFLSRFFTFLTFFILISTFFLHLWSKLDAADADGRTTRMMALSDGEDLVILVTVPHVTKGQLDRQEGRQTDRQNCYGNKAAKALHSSAATL